MYINKLEKKLKVSEQILKEKCWLKMLIKKVLMNLVKIFLIIKSINENKSIVLSVISIENLKTLKTHIRHNYIWKIVFDKCCSNNDTIYEKEEPFELLKILGSIITE